MSHFVRIIQHEVSNEYFPPTSRLLPDHNRPMPSRRCAKEELLPKTLRLDQRILDDICEIWRHFRRVGDGFALFQEGRRPYQSKFFGESDASNYFFDRIVIPVTETYNGLISSLRTTEEEEIPTPHIFPRLLRVLHRAHSATPRSEGPRSTVVTPSLDQLRTAGNRLDLDRAARLFPTATRLHQLNQTLASHPEDQPLDTHVYAIPDAKAIEEAKSFFSLSVPDHAIYLINNGEDPEDEEVLADDTVPEGDDANGGIPILLVEMKDPYRFTTQVVTDCLLRFNLHVTNDEVRMLFKDQGIITVREAINKGWVDGETAELLRSVSHLVRHMFFQRQTYGIWSTSLVTIVLRLDWGHATHPGQHVTFAICACARPDKFWPKWPAKDVRGDKFHLVGGATGLQSMQGLVDTETFERALLKMVEDHDTYSPAPKGTGDDSGGEQERSLDGADRVTRSGSRSTTSRHQQQDSLHHHYSTHDKTSESRSGFDVNHALLDCVDDPELREEIQRFLELDESRVVLKFRKSELLKMLCAAFPLDPIAAYKAPGNQYTLDQLMNLAQPSRPAIERASDPDLFAWGTIWDGFLPPGFARHLERIDDREHARLQRSDAPRLKGSSDGHSDDDSASDDNQRSSPPIDQPATVPPHSTSTTQDSVEGNPPVLRSNRKRAIGLGHAYPLALEPSDADSRDSSSSFSSIATIADKPGSTSSTKIFEAQDFLATVTASAQSAASCHARSSP